MTVESLNVLEYRIVRTFFAKKNPIDEFTAALWVYPRRSWVMYSRTLHFTRTIATLGSMRESYSRRSHFSPGDIPNSTKLPKHHRVMAAHLSQESPGKKAQKMMTTRKRDAHFRCPERMYNVLLLFTFTATPRWYFQLRFVQRGKKMLTKRIDHN